MVDFGEYHRLVGRLLYLKMTRSNISFVVQTLSEYIHSPKHSHLEATGRVVRYTKSAPGQELLLHSTGNDSLTTYCDADWGICVQKKRSVTRYLLLLKWFG